jgi:hypothetical protein
VREDAHLDVARVDLWEEREATGPKIWSGFGGRGGKGNGEEGQVGRRGAPVSVSVEHRKGGNRGEKEMDALEERHQA